MPNRPSLGFAPVTLTHFLTGDMKMKRFLSLIRWPSIFALVALGVAVSFARSGQGQVPINPDKLHLALFEHDIEVGRVYRDRIGPEYVEHWVLFPGYSFDRAQRAGAALHIELVEGGSYESVDDFLKNVPFPRGSRYVVVACQEFDSLPVGD